MVTNNAGGLIRGSVGIYAGAGSVITNMGTIESSVRLAPAIILWDGGTVINSGTGSLIFGGVAIGNLIFSNSGSVSNEGVIFGYDAVSMVGGTGIVTNSGRLDGIRAGVYLGAGGAVTNIGAASYIAALGTGVVVSGGPGMVTNAGTIAAGQFGVLFLDNYGTAFNNTVINSGTIIGNSGTAVQFGNGHNRLIVEAGYSFQGLVEGGASGANVFEVGSGSANFRGGGERIHRL